MPNTKPGLPTVERQFLIDELRQMSDRLVSVTVQVAVAYGKTKPITKDATMQHEKFASFFSHLKKSINRQIPSEPATPRAFHRPEGLLQAPRVMGPENNHQPRVFELA